LSPPSKVKSQIPDGLTSGQVSHDVLFQLPLQKGGKNDHRSGKMHTWSRKEKGEGGQFLPKRRQIKGVIPVYKIVNNTENGGEELLFSLFS